MFHHALLDLTRFDPAKHGGDSRMRAVLPLIKPAREKELLRFFQWLAGIPAKDLSGNLLGLILCYALHNDSDFDAEKIYHALSTSPKLGKNAMRIAEKLKAEGRIEGLWIGKIQ
jgi:hypothetical protein